MRRRMTGRNGTFILGPPLLSCGERARSINMNAALILAEQNRHWEKLNRLRCNLPWFQLF